MKTPLLACMLLAVIESSLFANAGFFGGSGHTIELSQSDQIQMVSEEVTIAPLPGFTSELDEVEYRCRFVLKNLSPTATTIQVGLPLDGESGEHSLDEDESSASDVDETDRVMSYRFIARDDDNTYHVRYLRQDRHAKFRRLFMWDMAFAPGREEPTCWIRSAALQARRTHSFCVVWDFPAKGCQSMRLHCATTDGAAPGRSRGVGTGRDRCCVLWDSAEERFGQGIRAGAGVVPSQEWLGEVGTY